MSGIIGGAGSKSGVIGSTEIVYETGLWEVAACATAGSPTSGYLGNSGKAEYTVIGRMVYLCGTVLSSENLNDTLYGHIGGFPFASKDIADQGNGQASSINCHACTGSGAGAWPADNRPTLWMDGGSVFAYIYRMDTSGSISGTGLNRSWSRVDLGSKWGFSISYIIA